MTFAMPDEIPLALRAMICPNCGYSLEGLKADEPCPECGRAPDASEIVLHGTDLRRMGEGWLVFPIIIFLNTAFISPRHWIFGVIAIALALMGYVGRKSIAHPRRVQIRIYPEGIVAFRQGTAATVLRRFVTGYRWTIPLLISVWLTERTVMYQLSLWFWLYFPACVLMFLTAAVMMLFSRRRFHRVRERSSATELADANLALYPISSWFEVREFWIDPLKNEDYVIRIDNRRRGHLGFVFARVRLSPAGAAELSTLLRERMTAARTAASSSETSRTEKLLPAVVQS